MALADTYLEDVYKALKLTNSTDKEKYGRIDDIVKQLQKINKQNTIDGKVTGTISERLCELALKTSVPEIYRTLTTTWNWMADFTVLGSPFNLLVSVKSFKAKERLLVSGSGNILSPTVGWGLFDDKNEWTEDRVKMYLYRCFIGIYIPESLYNAVDKSALAVKNINGKPFLRKISNFPKDLRKAIENDVISITNF